MKVFISFILLVLVTVHNILVAATGDIPFHPSPLDAPSSPPLPNLIDVLVHSPNHSILVRLFQRTRLIPTLINLMEFGDGRGLTIFAPTDDAIRRKVQMDTQKRQDVRSTPMVEAEYVEHFQNPRSIWEWAIHLIEEKDAPDQDTHDLIAPIWTADKTRLGNVNALLRQQLLYHMVNHTLLLNMTKDAVVMCSEGSADSVTSRPHPLMLSTLHLPSRRLLHEPTRPGPIPQPPGAEDHGALLGGEGQKVRLTCNGEKLASVGVDSKGHGGAQILDVNRSSAKGIVISIDGILELPPDLATVIRTNPSLQHLLNLTTDTALHSLTETSHATFLLPSASAFDALSSVEKIFLMGSWPLAEQERLKLLGEHMSGLGLGHDKIAYANRLRQSMPLNLTTIFGGQVLVNITSEGHLCVDNATIVQEDILTENGVVHVIDKLLLPFGDLNLSVEKSLLALNASRFVSLIHQAGLQHYIEANPHNADDPDNKAQPWTFMVPRDDAIDAWWRDRSNRHSEFGTYLEGKWNYLPLPSDEGLISDKENDLEDLLKYHIAPRMRTPQHLSDGMLIGTELRNWRLKDARQRVLVGVDDDSGSRNERQGNGDVGFGDANVIATPVIVGPSIIYLISQIMDPPSNPIQTAVSSLSLSTFVATVFSAELDKPIKRAPAITYLVPHNSAFSALGLAMPYLLLDQSKPRSELRSVVEYHAIDRIVYMKDFANESYKYPTLEGSPIWAGRGENGTIEVKRGTDGRNAHVIKGDLLTSTGVLHEIDQVELPPTLDLTIEKLMKGAKAETMRDLVQQAGYGWILNGSVPPEGFPTYDVMGKFPDRKHKNKQRKRHKNRHKIFDDHQQSYVVLCPTDSAFTRINLTYFYENKEELKKLVQMHIIPSPPDQDLPSGTSQQYPLNLRDASSFVTLLDVSLGGLSSYGKVAFRKLQTQAKPDSKILSMSQEGTYSEWIVGVADTRGTDGRRNSARILNFGRESLSIDRQRELMASQRHKPGHGGEEYNSRSIGGVLTIDAVLQPYTPGWFYRWGWVAMLSLFSVAALVGIGFVVWMRYNRDGQIRLPDALDGEEE